VGEQGTKDQETRDKEQGDKGGRAERQETRDKR
jgi:hypothetical protein